MPWSWGSSSQAPCEIEDLQDVLYRTVLERWRRCHCEGGLVAAELRSAEVALVRARKKEAAMLLHHLLCSHDTGYVQAVFHRWLVACAHLDETRSAQGTSAQLHSERGALQEPEVQLALAHEAEQALRMRWQSERAQWERERAAWGEERARFEQERARWHAQEEHELAMVTSITQHPITQSVTQTRERSEEHRDERPQREAGEWRSLLSHPPHPFDDAATARPTAGYADEAEWPRAPVRSFGARAEELVAAWKRESSAVKL